MKRFYALVLCTAALCLFAGCSESSFDEDRNDTEISGPASEYTYVKKVTGYTGSSAAVTSAFLKIYSKGGTYYATVGTSESYAVCHKNSNYSSSYTGRDPKKKYRYYAKPQAITYYFNL